MLIIFKQRQRLYFDRNCSRFGYSWNDGNHADALLLMLPATERRTKMVSDLVTFDSAVKLYRLENGMSRQLG